MRVLIYSDVHGNLPAFEKMITVENGVDQYICLGDLVNYGPWSNECVDLAISLPNSIILQGNHELAFLNGRYPGINPLVGLFFEKCISTFHRYREIGGFLLSYNLGKYLCIHTIDDLYIYPNTEIELQNNFLIGHTHCQFKNNSNGFELFNTGSVGQNRMYINEINYLIYDTEKYLIEMKSCLYQVDLLISKMIDLKYPSECIDYYKNKNRK